MEELNNEEMKEIDGGAWLKKNEKFTIKSNCRAYKVSDCKSVTAVDFKTKSATYTTLAKGSIATVYSSNWYALWDIDNPSKRILGNEGWNIITVNGTRYFVQANVIKNGTRITKSK